MFYRGINTPSGTAQLSTTVDSSLSVTLNIRLPMAMISIAIAGAHTLGTHAQIFGFFHCFFYFIFLWRNSVLRGQKSSIIV